MKLDIDSQPIELTCPSCAKKFKEKLGRLKNNPTLPCPACRTPIRIDANELRKGIESVQKSADDLGRTLGNLFQ